MVNQRTKTLLDPGSRCFHRHRNRSRGNSISMSMVFCYGIGKDPWYRLQNAPNYPGSSKKKGSGFNNYKQK